MKQFFLSLCITALLIPQSLFTVSLDDFDPNFILSDEELNYWQSMDLGAIQRFLTEKGGAIATLQTPDTDGVIKSAAEIIYDTARKYGINPKYIIVKLQKEQSLVTAKNPTQKQLDWATGYAVCDSCSMDDPRIQKFRGFGHQVDYAAGVMRWYYDNVDSQGFIRRPGETYTISGQTVQPVTLATAFLYTYTPHILGNKNFWLLWNAWFESRIPDGTLIKGTTRPEVYLIQDGKKRHFKNYTALITRFDPKFVVTVPDAELDDYPSGSAIDLPNYSVLEQSGNYYLLDYDTLRPFANQSVVRDLGYNPDEIISVSTADIQGYTIGRTITAQFNPLGELVYVPEVRTYFYVKDGVYHTIVDERIIPINYGHLTSVQRPISYIEELVQGPEATIKDGIIFGIEGFNEIYVMENGVKRHIANPAVFEGLGYKWENIQWVSTITGIVIPTGKPLDSAPSRDTRTQETATFDTSRVELTSADQGISSQRAATTPTTATTQSNRPEDQMLRTASHETTYIGTPAQTDLEAYLVYDVEKKEIVAGKNIDVVRQPASLQKVMTAYLLDELDLDLSAGTTYNERRHKAVYHGYRVVENERIRNANLLDAFLVSSLNTPGRMLVDSATANEPAFITQMNTRAAAWKLTNTHFVDVTGESDQNKTTAREYLTIFLHGIESNLVRSYLSKPSYQYTALVDLDGKPNHQDVHSNQLLRKADLPYTILSSKTGFLWVSGPNLAMHVKRTTDGKEFVIISMGNPNFDDRFTAPDDLTRWALRTF